MTRRTSLPFVFCGVLLLYVTQCESYTDGLRQDSSLSTDLKSAVAKFKVDFHHSLQSAKIRKKRESGLLADLTEENAFVKEHLRVGSSVPEDLDYLSEYNLTFWTSVRHQGKNGVLVGTAKGDLILFELQNRIATAVARSTGEAIGYKAKAFSHYDELWFTILQSLPNPCIRLYKRVGRGIERRQTIVLEGESDFDLVTVRGIHYLAVATYKARTSQGYTYQAHVDLYHWTQTQFDVIATGTTSGARSLACWVLDGSLYLSVAQGINDKNLYIGSPVFVYNAKEENNLVLAETLNTKAPRKCAHFFVRGSHYLIFIGQFDGVIYWWSGNQFLEWQTVKGSAGGVDVSVISLSQDEVIIVIALEAEILFFTLDAAGYYIVTFRMEMTGYSISSLQFMWDGEDYFALALQASLKPSLHPTWRLGLETYRLPKEGAMDPLLRCMYRVQSRLEEREAEIEHFNSRVEKVWLKDKEQNIPGRVIVKGSVTSEGHPVELGIVKITSKETEILPWTPSSIDEEIDYLFRMGDGVSSKLRNSLKKSSDQIINGTKHFAGLVETPSFSVVEYKPEFLLNGIPISKYLANTVKTSGDQNFQGSLNVEQLSVINADALSIRNLSTIDFLLLKGEQLVKGSLYFSNVSATDIEAGPGGVLNSIEVDKLITTNTDQEVRGLKSFSLLSSEVIDVHGYTNGESLDEIKKKVVDINGGGEISGNLEFDSPVIVQGNVFYSGLINNAVNISDLALKGVNKHSDQEITGSKTFLSNINVSGDLNTEGYINGVNIDKDVITLSTDQNISGHLTFTSPLTFEKNLLADLINDQDLDVSSVLKREQQFIEGHITFDSSLIADEIKMADLKTLDYVDPSELEKTLVQLDHGAVKEAVVIKNAVVRGNLIIDDEINELPIKDLPYIAYLKSKPQEISVPVLFPGSITVKDLEVDLLNDLDLDSDVVHTTGDEMVLAQKVFQDIVDVKNFDVGQGILLGGIDVLSLRNITNHPDETTVHGVKILDSLEVKGSLTAGSVNGLDLSKDLMLINEPQYIPGKKKFESAVVISELLAANISPEIVNGQNFTDFISNAVLSRPSSTREISNKTFTELKASDLRFLDNSKIDGVFIPEMLLKAVTLNTSQYITGDKTFSGSLQFTSFSSAARVNDLDLVSHTHKIIFLDKEEVIRGRKTFHGNLHASDLTVHNLVNGVNLTLLFRDAIYKSKRNEVSAPMVFATDLHIGSLIVKKPALIDGISMDDLVFVNKESFFDYIELRTNLSIHGNLNVNGLVNDCDLNTVLKEALKLDGTEQVLTGVTEFNSLNVTGSVTFRDTVSDVEITDLFKVVTRSDNHIVHGNFHFGSGIAVRNLRLKGLVQGVDLGFILSDAVRKSKSQVIKGQKVFKDDLETGVLDGSDGLFVTKTVNSVNMNELSRDVVWRDGYQVIHGEKIFNSLYANNVTAFGYLNGLKIPRDVVLTFTSDTVFSPVHVMKDLVIESHLTVYGKMDGVDLKSFLDQRATLETDEELTAEVIFKKVFFVKGEMVVDGMINGVVPEMVVMSNKENKISGKKIFHTDLDVDGSMKTAFINGYNLTELLSSLLRLDNSERLQGLQVFTQPIHMNLAIINSINGIALEYVEGAFINTSNSVLEIENFLDRQNQLHLDQIEMQMEAALYQISDFAYFTKVQELNIGSSSKLLIGHRVRSTENLFYQTMVLWTTRTTCATPRKCCESVYSYWLEADDGFITAIKEPEEGRYFPVRGPNLFPADGNFVTWTNTTSEQPTWCHSRMHETTIVGNVENAFEIFLTINNSPLLTDLKAFREGKLYIVASYSIDKRSGDYSRSVVYVYNDMSRQWKEHQLLSAYGVLAMDITSYRTDSNILLALGTGLGSFPKSELLLYSWNDTARMFLETQRRPSDYVTSVLWADNKNRKLLVVSSVANWPDSTDCSKEISGGRMEVYEYYASLKWIQSIPLSGVVSMTSFQVAGETYVAAASRQLETVYLLKWKGFGGFSIVQAIYSPGVRHLNTYRRQNEIFMTISSASGSSSVLKAVIKGKTYYQRSEEEFPVELKDSPDLQSSQTSC